MVQGYLDYIDKQECEEKGCRREKRVYKLNTLEQYAEKGWLEYGNLRYSALDRVAVGNDFYEDFYLSKISNISANDVSKVRVDGGGNTTVPETVLDARNRYIRASRAIPYEFRGVVRRVCCEDREVVITGASERQRAYERRKAALLLCLGLDRLIEHYKRKK